MSAFIVEDKTINEVLAGLSVSNDHCIHIGHRHSINLHDIGQRELLGQQMFALNVDAVNERYGDGEAEQFRPLDYQFKSVLPLDTVRTYKSLQCWLYQCSEGNVPETPLFKTMDAISDYLAHYIVGRSEAYEKANWG